MLSKCQLLLYSSVFLTEKSHGQEPGRLQSVGCKEPDATEHACTIGSWCLCEARRSPQLEPLPVSALGSVGGVALALTCVLFQAVVVFKFLS